MTDYSVTKLDLSNQGLTELPKDIHLYKNLKRLYCTYNQITMLPENLPDSLKLLDCNNNQLTALPENLPSLYYLDCNNNQITTLPENLPASLKELVCSNNLLTTLPENLPASLKCLDCHNNPFTNDYDFEITIETLPRYYREKEERERNHGEGMYNAVFK